MATRVKLVYLTPALEDFEEIVKYHITRVGPASARGIYRTMKEAVNRLREYPLLGQTHPDLVLAQKGYRKLVLTKTYIAVYKVIDDTVCIYRIVNVAGDHLGGLYSNALAVL